MFCFVFYLVHLVPCGVQICLDDLTGERFTSDVDFDVGVALSFHHASHQVVFRNQVLTRQEVNPEQALEKQKRRHTLK